MRQDLAKDDIFALKLSIVPNNHSFLRLKSLSVAHDSFHQYSLSTQKFDHLVYYGYFLIMRSSNESIDAIELTMVE